MGTSKETSDSAKDLEKLIVKYLNALSHEVGKIFGGDGLSVLNPILAHLSIEKMIETRGYFETLQMIKTIYTKVEGDAIRQMAQQESKSATKH
jgi:hypothetical protein